jgi:vancomycin resistance protein VanW
MIGSLKVPKPIRRSKLRKYFGRKYFIIKRKLSWIQKSSHFAKVSSKSLFKYSYIKHDSLLLRPLRNVDMQYQHNKIKNLELAINNIDGIIIKPQQTFSFWYLVGNPTKRKGYLKGLVLRSGKIGYDYGGGLCQLGNLLYWMVLHSPLEITERYRHSYDVFPDVNRKLPFGSGATLSYNYIDLQFKNNSNQDFQIHLWLTKDRLNGELLSEIEPPFQYQVYEDGHLFKQEFWGGYTRHNILKRKIIDKVTKEEIAEELITENHAVMMYSPLVE